jgi:EmrB/QacA subfamily drug resistance transporter
LVVHTNMNETKGLVIQSERDKTILLWLLALTMLLVVLDSSVVNVALPAIKAALGFNQSTLQWIFTVYVLTFGGFLLLGGRTADLYGRRKILVAGVAGFSLFSFMTGIAVSVPMLIVARALQGLAAAFMAPAALSILLITFKEGQERNRALSVWTIVAAGGGAVGVFLGGLLTQYLGWRWNFFINVPVGIFAVIGILKYVPAHAAEASDTTLDLPGAILVTVGFMGLVFSLTQASQIGWTAPMTVASFALSILIIGCFVLNETRAKHPLVPLSIFRIRNVSGGNMMMLPVVAAAFGMFFFLSLYIQNVLHYSPVQTGLCFLPVPIIIGVLSYYAPAMLDRFGFKPLLVAGTALATLGIYLMSLITTHSVYIANLLPPLVILGFGFGTAFVAITVAATTGVSEGEAGLASGLINASQQLGGALGLGALVAVASATSASKIAAGASLMAASVDGYRRAFLCAAILMALALIVGITVIRAPSASPRAHRD